jgi:hypothetical protein
LFQIVVTYFGPSHNKKNQKKKIKKKCSKKIKKISMKRVYQNTHEIAKDWLRKIKYTRFKNLTVYFQLVKALLANKIQFEEANSKLDV